MIPEQLRDLQASLVVVTHLEAGFKGVLAYHELLRKVESAASDQRMEVLAYKALAKIFRWMESLENGDSLVSLAWGKPETFEARDAFTVLEQLKKDTQRVFTETCKIFSRSTSMLAAEDIKIVIATLLRCEVSEFSFVARQRLIAEAKQIPEDIENSRMVLQEAVRESAPALALITDYTDGNQTTAGPGFLSTLLPFLERLPMRLALQLHHLNMLLGSYSGVGYEMVEIPPREVPKWQALGLIAEEASFWRAHGFLPDEVLQWRQRGFGVLQEAFDWRDRGFSAAEAWSLRQAGHDPESAEMMRSGMLKAQTRALPSAPSVESKREVSAPGRDRGERGGGSATTRPAPADRPRVQASDMATAGDMGEEATPSEVVQTKPRGGRPIGSLNPGSNQTGGEHGEARGSLARQEGIARKGKLVANSK